MYTHALRPDGPWVYISGMLTCYVKEDKPAFTMVHYFIQRFVNIDCRFKLWHIMIMGFAGCSDTISNKITTLWMPKVTQGAKIT